MLFLIFLSMKGSIEVMHYFMEENDLVKSVYLKLSSGVLY